MLAAEALPQLVRVAVLRPTLVLQHAAGYGALLLEAFERVRTRGWQRTALAATGACALVIGLLLTGIALLLDATTAASTINTAPGVFMGSARTWTLVLVPALPLLVSVVALVLASLRPPIDALAELRQQLREDLDLLRDLAR